MDYKKFDNLIAVRLDKGDSTMSSLLFVAKKENLTLASIQGIGATDDFEVGVFDLEKSEYDRIRYTGNHEINSPEPVLQEGKQPFCAASFFAWVKMNKNKRRS